MSDGITDAARIAALENINEALMLLENNIRRLGIQCDVGKLFPEFAREVAVSAGCAVTAEEWGEHIREHCGNSLLRWTRYPCL